MHNFLNNFTETLDNILPQDNLPKKLAVAISGGCDSLALTILLKEYCTNHNIELFAITVDHKMRVESSKEAKQLGEFLEAKQIFHKILEIDNSKIPEKNIEANLREERYKLLHEFCKNNQIKFLFLGHIQGDIAENFIIRLFRGSGLDGLSSISQLSDFRNIKLVRPLLDNTKDELKNFLSAKNIQWFEDETNADEKFLRNKIRKFFDTFEEKDLIQKRIKNSTDEISQIRDLFDDLMLKEAEKALDLHENGFFTINLSIFSKIEKKISLKILALTLMEVGGKPYKPRLEKLKRFYEWIIKSDGYGKEKHKLNNFYGCSAKYFDDNRLAIYREGNSVNEHYNIELKTVLKTIFETK